MNREPLSFVLAFCRLLTLALALVVLALTSTARANGYTGEPTWRRVVVADEVTITTHVVSINELVEMQTGRRVDVRNVRHTQHRGFAKLYRNTESGAWTCHVYVTANASADTLEHETRHCHGWVHE